MCVNLSKAQRRWGGVEKVLMNMGETVRSREMMYKAVVQTVLIYGSGSWVVTDVILKVVDGFHHQVAWRITGVSAWQVKEVEWE